MLKTFCTTKSEQLIHVWHVGYTLRVNLLLSQLQSWVMNKSYTTNLGLSVAVVGDTLIQPIELHGLAVHQLHPEVARRCYWRHVHIGVVTCVARPAAVPPCRQGALLSIPANWGKLKRFSFLAIIIVHGRTKAWFRMLWRFGWRCSTVVCGIIRISWF